MSTLNVKARYTSASRNDQLVKSEKPNTVVVMVRVMVPSASIPDAFVHFKNIQYHILLIADELFKELRLNDVSINLPCELVHSELHWQVETFSEYEEALLIFFPGRMPIDGL